MLAKYLRSKINNKNKLIHKIKMQRSSGNNLLQLADYLAGTINRSISEGGQSKFRKIIAHREIRVQIWPQKTSDPILFKERKR